VGVVSPTMLFGAARIAEDRPHVRHRVGRRTVLEQLDVRQEAEVVEVGVRAGDRHHDRVAGGQRVAVGEAGVEIEEGAAADGRLRRVALGDAPVELAARRVDGVGQVVVAQVGVDRAGVGDLDVLLIVPRIETSVISSLTASPGSAVRSPSWSRSRRRPARSPRRTPPVGDDQAPGDLGAGRVLAEPGLPEAVALVVGRQALLGAAVDRVVHGDRAIGSRPAWTSARTATSPRRPRSARWPRGSGARPAPAAPDRRARS
jgi:hypothetical protein